MSDRTTLIAQYWGYIVTDEEARKHYLGMCERMDEAPGFLSPSAILINPEPLDEHALAGLQAMATGEEAE